MEDTPEVDLGPLKFLKALVTTLMIVMIVGFIVLIGFLVTRFPGNGPVPIGLPESIQLPDGITPVAFTQTENWYAVVSKSDNILIFDRDTGAVLKTIKINFED